MMDTHRTRWLAIPMVLAGLSLAAKAIPPDAPAGIEDGTRSDHPPIPVRSQVRSPLTLIQILPNGSRVAKDQLVCEFDAMELRDRLAYQQLATERANADVDISKRVLEIAELQLNEYVNEQFPWELKKADAEVMSAEMKLRFARERLEDAEEKDGAGVRSTRFILRAIRAERDEADEEKAEAEPDGEDEDLAITPEEFEVVRAIVDLELARKKRELLVNFVEKRERLRFQGDLEKATAEVLGSRSRFEESKAREEDLRRSIELCKVYAPADGVIEYREPRIGTGAVVRRGGVIFVLNPDEPIAVEERRERRPGIGPSGFPNLPPEMMKEFLDRLREGNLPGDDEVDDLRQRASEAFGRPVSEEQVRALFDRFRMFQEMRDRSRLPDSPF